MMSSHLIHSINSYQTKGIIERKGPLFRNIHSQVAKRLIFAWFVVSVLVGAGTVYLEIRNADQLAFSIALNASESLQDHVAKEGVQHIDALNAELAILLDHGYVQAQVVGKSGQVISKLSTDSHADLLGQLKSSDHQAQSSTVTTIFHKTVWLDSVLIVQVNVPLRDSFGEVIGHFSGIYRVDDETRTHARNDIIRTVSMVLLAIPVTTFLLYPLIIGLHRGVLQLSDDLMRSNIELMEVLGSAIAKRDSDTDLHNYRVCLYSITFAEALGLTAVEIRAVIVGAFLHDVGKIGISDTILLKRGKLTDEEFSTMKSHVQLGVDIVAKASWIDDAKNIIEFHHEKFDGSGYSKGLNGESIPLSARLFAIVDVFDALTSRRPYKQAFALEDAIRILEEGSESHFDPRLIKAFTVIAVPMHQQLSSLTEVDLQNILHQQVSKYFLEVE